MDFNMHLNMSFSYIIMWLFCMVSRMEVMFGTVEYFVVLEKLDNLVK